MLTKTNDTLRRPSLPADLTDKDTKPPAKWKDATGYSFQLWFIANLGWVLPTLLISRSNRGNADRYYAVGVGDKRTYRVGKGPHVLHVVTIHGCKRNAKVVAKYIELKREGMAAACTIRDRISSRRAEGELHRAAGHRSWRWGTM